jgi:hypothetical protein
LGNPTSVRHDNSLRVFYGLWRLRNDFAPQFGRLPSAVRLAGGWHAETLQPCEIAGLIRFEKFLPLVEAFHDDGTHRDKADNRKLYYDPFMKHLLLAMFNSSTRMLRALQQGSLLEKLRKNLGVLWTSLRAFSETAAPRRLARRGARAAGPRTASKKRG